MSVKRRDRVELWQEDCRSRLEQTDAPGWNLFIGELGPVWISQEEVGKMIELLLEAQRVDREKNGPELNKVLEQIRKDQEK